MPVLFRQPSIASGFGGLFGYKFGTQVRGRSYDALVAKADALPFRIKRPGEGFFDEGDVSEISTLVEVDAPFVAACATTIREVSEALERAGH